MIDEQTLLLTPDGFKPYTDVSEVCNVDPIRRTQFFGPANITSEYYKGPLYSLEARNTDIMVTPDHLIWTGKNCEQAKNIFQTKGKLPQLSRWHELSNRQNLNDVLWSARMIASLSRGKDDYTNDLIEEAFDITKNINYVDARCWINEYLHWNVKQPLRNVSFLAKLYIINVRCINILEKVALRAGHHCIFKYNNDKTYAKNVATKTHNNVVLSLYIVKDSDTVFRPEQWSVVLGDGMCYDVRNETGLFIAKRFGRTFLMTGKEK